MEKYKKNTNINTNMVKLKCKRCGYEWEYNGNSEWYTSCSRCRTTINIKKQKEEAEQKVRKSQKEVRIR